MVPAASQYWNQQGITSQFLTKLWAILWARKQQHKILHVQWLVVLRALPVGTWLHRMGVSSCCTRCHLQTETQKHCLWNALILNRYGNGSLELSDTRDVVPTASQYWNQQGITPQFLAKFWAILGARKQQHKILHVQWLVVHRALPVGTWLHRMGVDVIYKQKLKNIVYGNALILNRYGNGSLDFR